MAGILLDTVKYVSYDQSQSECYRNNMEKRFNTFEKNVPVLNVN